MRLKAALLILLAIILAGAGSCDVITGNFSAGNETSDITSMLRFLPCDGTTTMLYNNLQTLTEQQGSEVPLRVASSEEKEGWWTSVQSSVLWGYPNPLDQDLWGFDTVDVTGILTAWGDYTPVTVLSGNLDAAAIRQKLLSFHFEETPLFESALFVADPTSGYPSPGPNFPLAFGIVEAADSHDKPSSYILMSEPGGTNISLARESIEGAITAYHQKASLADSYNQVRTLADSLGEVGSAFLANETRFAFVLGIIDETIFGQIKAAIGPGEINYYEALSLSSRMVDGATVLEFILAYQLPDDASTDAPVLKERLVQGRNLRTGIPLSDLWTVSDVGTSGTLLRANVNLTEKAKADELFFTAMIYTIDYWFLYPGVLSFE